MFCVKCGTRNAASDRFCKQCGTEISEKPQDNQENAQATSQSPGENDKQPAERKLTDDDQMTMATNGESGQINSPSRKGWLMTLIVGLIVVSLAVFITIKMVDKDADEKTPTSEVEADPGEEPDIKEDKDSMEEQETHHLSDDEILQIATALYQAIDADMRGLQDYVAENNMDVGEAINNFDTSVAAFNELYDKAEKTLEKYFINDFEKKEDSLVHHYLIQYFTYFHYFLDYQQDYLAYRFNVLEQTRETIKYESIELSNEIDNSTAKIKVTLKSQDDVWKISGSERISPSEEPYNLTYEDLLCVADEGDIDPTAECVFISTVEENGSDYIVYKTVIDGSTKEGTVIAVDANTSELNSEIAQRYQ